MRGIRVNGYSAKLEVRANKITYKCPYCGVIATLSPLVFTDEHCICRCDNTECQKSFCAKIKIVREHMTSDNIHVRDLEILETYPKHVPKKHESIPQNIWSDYLEACKCFDVGAFKSTVVMCRRTLQNACLERGATKKDEKGNWISLKNQIISAFPEKDYLLIHSIAERLKYFGDYGAHPQNDGIDNVTKEDANELLDFLDILLRIAFIDQWRIEQLKGKMEGKNKF